MAHSHVPQTTCHPARARNVDVASLNMLHQDSRQTREKIYYAANLISSINTLYEGLGVLGHRNWVQWWSWKFCILRVFLPHQLTWMEMYMAFITRGLISGAARACLRDELFVISAISRTPTIVSLLRGGVLLSMTTHAPLMQERQHVKIITAAEVTERLYNLFIFNFKCHCPEITWGDNNISALCWYSKVVFRWILPIRCIWPQTGEKHTNQDTRST